MSRTIRMYRTSVVLAGAIALVGCAATATPRAPLPLGPAGPTGQERGSERHGLLPAEPVGYPSRQVEVGPRVPFKLLGIHPAPTYTPIAAPSSPSLDGKLLVIAADRGDIQLPAITQALDMAGTPYTVWIASERPGQLGLDQLASGNRGFYQGIILTQGVPVYNAGSEWRTALSQLEWEALWAYQAAFKVRQVTWYTWPTADYGFGAPEAVDTSTTPVEAGLTADGATAFPLLNPQSRIPIRHAYLYRARPLDANTTPLVSDDAGNALVAVKRYEDGRENLAMTFDSNPNLLHSQVLSHAVIHWVTRGIYLGERRTYMSAHIDDFFYPNDLWGGGQHRMDATDLLAALSWQRAKQLDPVSAGFKFDLAFNGEGSNGSIAPDTLTPAVKTHQAQFKWINHTFTHMNLDAVDEATARAELDNNFAIAQGLKFTEFDRESLVTGEVSGLKNPAAMAAAFKAGVRFIIADTSRAGEDNPSPNTGLYNWSQSGLLMVPRRPTNMFYNVSTPELWTGEYNAMYRSYWGKDLSYSELLDKESDVLLGYLLKGELNPWMFHQSNLETYQPDRSILSDLLDRTLAKYKALMRAPITSPTMTELGRTMGARMAYNQAGVTASITPGVSVTLRANQAATVALTGVVGGGSVMYGGVPLTRVSLSAGQTLTLPLVSAPTPTAPPAASPAPTPRPKPTPKPKKNN